MRRSGIVSRRSAVGVLALVVFVLASVLLTRHDFTHDFTRGQRRSLAPQTLRVLEMVDRPIEVLAFYAEVPEEQASLYDLVQRYREHAPELELTLVDPDRRPELAEEHGVSVNRTVVLVDGDLEVRTVAPSEAELTGALVRLLSGQPPRVYFVEGHGEASVEDESRGGIRAAAQLLARQNFELRILQTAVVERIPRDADVLVLAAPERPLAPREVALLTDYLLRGGRLMAMLEPRGSSSADSLVSLFGIQPEDGFVVDASAERANLTRDSNVRFAVALGGRPGHPISDGFNLPVIFPLARSLRSEQPPPPGVEVQRLVETTASTWRETDLSTLVEGDPEFDPAADGRGPLALGFAAGIQLREFQLDRQARETLTSTLLRMAPQSTDFRDSSLQDSVAIGGETVPRALGEQARMVVLGDVSFIDNANLRVQGNGDFFLACMLWLAEQENRIALAPRPDLSDPVVLTGRQLSLLRWGALLVLPGLMLIVAVLIFRWRRNWL